ncbi:MAG: SufD family Fe-S cluster assembly protein [Chloroflexota bacterium]|nr:SufD family Fe-S cluster assembly protein [Chloroflexota bacterium]
MSEVNEKIESAKAANPSPALGDIDLESFSKQAEEHSYQEDFSKIAEADRQRMEDVGVVLGDSAKRSGTFLQKDHSVIHSKTQQDGVEIMSTPDAMQKYLWLSDYLWKLVSPEADKFTRFASDNPYQGYFIRVLPGVKADYPVQSCLYLAKHGLAQNVHNIVIVEEGAELNIITGCAIAPMNDEGLHVGISEFYIKKGAKLNFTMIHNWAPKMEVRPRTGIIIEEDAVFTNNYICLKPVHTLQTYPIARCVGKNARASFNSVLVATSGAHLDVGSRVLLEAEGTKAEIVSRAITTGGKIIARGFLSGQVADVKGHLECRGLILGESGTILAIPELEGTVAGVDLSHEAAVGKIAEEEIEYFMARGLSRDAAVSTIVRGFLSVDIEGLPPELAAQIQHATDLSQQEVL